MDVGARIDRYQIAEVFEDEEDGGTYRVWDVDSGDRFVLKLRLPDATTELHDALRREYRIQSSLHDPNIAHASRLFSLPDGSLAMILDHAKGGALSGWMTGRPVAPRLCRVVLEGVLHGLQTAHDAGFVHRDIKPENVFLSQTSKGFVAQVGDFGLAKDLNEGPDDEPVGISLHFSMLGTPGYMAPEQATDPSAADARADLFSVGCMLYEMLTGDLPYDPDQPGFMLKLIKGEWNRHPVLPDWALTVLEVLLQSSPAQRPASAAEVLAMLDP